MKLLNYSPADGEYTESVMIDKIVRFSKSADGEITFIHLANGEIIPSEDSLKTLEARVFNS